MEQDYEFPNPVRRPMLNPPARKWRRYVLGTAGLALAVLILFLPQIFSGRLGRELIKLRLESQFRGHAWVTDLKTSWLGPTTVSKFVFIDGEGRQVRFERLTSSAGFWRVLMGGLNLKRAQVDDLYAEYVVNYGDGSDSLDRMPAGSNPPGGGPPQARPGPLPLPDLSGQITLRNATLVLTRGQIQGSELRSSFRSARLSHVSGTVDIRSLDRPWSAKLSGEVANADEQPGRFDLAGTISLGQAGHFDIRQATADVSLTMRNVPNRTGASDAPLLWVLLPLLPAEDYTPVLGDWLQTVDMHFVQSNGSVRFDKFELTGEPDGGKATRIAGNPVIDLASFPRRVVVASPLTASVELSETLARSLARINPFLRNASSGRVDATIDSLSLPLWDSTRGLNATGRLALSDVVLRSSPVSPADAFPHELTTQWQAIVGNLAPQVTMQAPATPFAVTDGTSKLEGATMHIGDLPLTLSGWVSAGGRFQMQAEVGLPPAMAKAGPGDRLTVPVEGTLQRPQMVLPDNGSAQGSPPSQLGIIVGQHLAALRERQNDQLFRLSATEVQKMMQTVDRVNESASDRKK